MRAAVTSGYCQAAGISPTICLQDIRHTVRFVLEEFARAVQRAVNSVNALDPGVKSDMRLLLPPPVCVRPLNLFGPRLRRSP